MNIFQSIRVLMKHIYTQQPQCLLNYQPSHFFYIAQLLCNALLKCNFLLNCCMQKNFHMAQAGSFSTILGCGILCHTFLDGRELHICVCATQCNTPSLYHSDSPETSENHLHFSYFVITYNHPHTPTNAFVGLCG